MRRLALILGLLAFLALVGGVVWTALDRPPLSLVLSHGLPPAGGPTGRRVTVEEVTFVEIGTGYFRMGSWFRCDPGDLLGRVCARFRLPWGRRPMPAGDEVPVRWVEIREPYWIAETELTNEQYWRFRPLFGVHRRLPGERNPVVIVDYEEALRYCAWLTSRGPLLVRLPSEAEWENACRAGSESEYGFGDTEAGLREHAWYAGNAAGEAGEVATRKPNRWGLFDMHGNVWEWCEDRYHPDYRNAPRDQAAWIDGLSPLRVNRGGSWTDRPSLCRSAHRDATAPSSAGSNLGFRPAASAR